MKEVLFRGKNLNGAWLFGNLIEDECGTVFYITKVGSHCERVEKETIGQYTGLCDKNGTKIFEGDIVIDRYECEKFGFVGEVKYVDQRSAFEIVSKTHPGYIANLGSRIQSTKVIGNIYDNPGLLVGVKNADALKEESDERHI